MACELSIKLSSVSCRVSDVVGSKLKSPSELLALKLFDFNRLPQLALLCFRIVQHNE
jgi:hypothetical protein